MPKLVDCHLMKTFCKCRISYLPVLCVIAYFLTVAGLSAQDQYFRSKLTGYSMYPTIKSGEYVLYVKTTVQDLNNGDIIVYKDRFTGERVCHRVVNIIDGRVKAKGDNNRFRDRGFITDEELIGLVTHIKNKPT